MSLQGSRKLIGLGLVVAATVALAWIGRLDEGLMWFLGGLYTAYCGGNGLEHLSARRGMPPLPRVIPRGDRTTPPAEVLRRLETAGVDLDGLREELHRTEVGHRR